MKRRVLVVVAGICLLAVGCTSEPEPSSGPRVSKPTTTRPSMPTVAPTVSGGLDLRPYLPKACSLLTADQRKANGLHQTFQGGHADSGICTWETADSEVSVAVSATEDPLVDVYAQRNDRYHGYFEPITIGGFPAVRTWPAPPPAGGCYVYVGTGHDQGLFVTSARKSNGDVNDDWCGRAAGLAEAMVATAQG